MKKLGIAFGGGGGRGAYQIGVWQALRETRLDKVTAAVSGTSVGALNACLFLQGSIETAFNIWKGSVGTKILLPQPHTIKAVKKLSFASLSELAGRIGSQGAFSREGLLEIIEGFLDMDIISKSSIPFTVAAVNTKKNKVEYFKINLLHPEMIKIILCATSAIPWIFPPEKINGTLYMDGGIPLIGDNCPIRPLANQGCDTVIAIPLDRISGINKEEFPYTRIVEIMPSNALWGPVSAIDGLLDFSPKEVLKRIRLGYEDAMKVLWQNNLTDIIAFKAKPSKKQQENP